MGEGLAPPPQPAAAGSSLLLKAAASLRSKLQQPNQNAQQHMAREARHMLFRILNRLLHKPAAAGCSRSHLKCDPAAASALRSSAYAAAGSHFKCELHQLRSSCTSCCAAAAPAAKLLHLKRKNESALKMRNVKGREAPLYVSHFESTRPECEAFGRAVGPQIAEGNFRKLGDMGPEGPHIAQLSAPRRGRKSEGFATETNQNAQHFGA